MIVLPSFGAIGCIVMSHSNDLTCTQLQAKLSVPLSLLFLKSTYNYRNSFSIHLLEMYLNFILKLMTKAILHPTPRGQTGWLVFLLSIRPNSMAIFCTCIEVVLSVKGDNHKCARSKVLERWMHGGFSTSWGSCFAVKCNIQCQKLYMVLNQRRYNSYILCNKKISNLYVQFQLLHNSFGISVLSVGWVVWNFTFIDSEFSLLQFWLQMEDSYINLKILRENKFEKLT